MFGQRLRFLAASTPIREMGTTRGSDFKVCRSRRHFGFLQLQFKGGETAVVRGKLVGVYSLLTCTRSFLTSQGRGVGRTSVLAQFIYSSLW